MKNRPPAVAAIAFALLFVAALLIVPPLPGFDASGEAVVAHLIQHSAAVRLQALLVALGSLALVVVLGHARTRLQGASAHVFTIGSAVVLAEFAVEMWFTAGLALNAHKLTPAAARVLADIASMWGPLLTVADVMVAVPIVLAANQHRFPRWLGILAAIFALEQLIETVTIVGGAGFFAPGGIMNLYVGGPLFVVFFLALGLTSLSESAQSTSKNDSPSSGEPST